MSEGSRSVAVEFVAQPPHGRVFTATRRVQPGDVDGRGRLRLEALARYLQDLATDDAEDAGLRSPVGVWMMRRVDIHVSALPSYGDQIELHTFASGTGPRWAERRTTIGGPSGLGVEAVAVWVFVDRVRGRPLPITDEFRAVYGESAGDRRVSVRLSHRRPPVGGSTRVWPLRENDFDLLDHVNNARYLEAVEDEMSVRLRDWVVLQASVEYRGAVERGESVELVSEARELGEDTVESMVWLLVEGEVRMSALVMTGDRDPGERWGLSSPRSGPLAP